MRKRKTQGAGNLDNTGGYSATLGNSSPGHRKEAMSNFGVVKGIMPAARDGHSAILSEQGDLFLFGGDRHHMPFNDLYLMKL
jgi:hypothetical protein